MWEIKITSWTSSFRYPSLITALQPTLEVPPPSTVLGLINSAAGKHLDHHKITIGYYFKYGGLAIDLETIYQNEIGKGLGKRNYNLKKNVIKRQFLFDNALYMYVDDEQIVEYFQNPHHQLVLGRSNDLATVQHIKRVNMTENNCSSKIKGQVIPFFPYKLGGVIQPLAEYFNADIPRGAINVKPYSIISHLSNDFKTNITTHSTIIDGEEVDVYLHKFNF